LGVDQHVCFDEIRKASRGLAVKYHPDKNPNPSAHDQFVAISEAYEALIDAQRQEHSDYFYHRFIFSTDLTPYEKPAYAQVCKEWQNIGRRRPNIIPNWISGVS
jgi:curved DNA-binding protein CbpA